MKLRMGELFAGYGGLGMGVQQVIDAELAWYSEIDKGALKILAHRFPGIPNVGDITTVDWSQVEPVDILTGGSPCQDLSHAGKRAGMTDGTRSNLWVAMREAIAQLRPSLVIWENVRGAYSAAADSAVEPCAGCVGNGSAVNLRALGRVLGDLSELGYDAIWHGLRAADIGAPHGRFRVFVVAYPRRIAGEVPLAGRLAAVAQLAGDGDPGRVGLTPFSTPRATDGTKGGPNQRGSSGDLILPSAVNLLPTPMAQEPGGTPAQYRARWAKSDGRASTFLPLSMAVSLIPTPSVADAAGGYERRGGARGEELLLKGMAKEGHLERWGQYADAIVCWERLTANAPAPTELGTKGTPRLAAAFSEWMMGLPAGWVTDTPGITRNEALKALGNGVVPQQAATGISWALAHIERAA